ncbi:MAG: L-lactate dehydrogenase [Sphingobium sp.]
MNARPAGKPDRSEPERDRVAIIGAGHVGATTAYALMLRALFQEILLIDSDAQRAAAEAQDIADANALARPARIWAGDYADAATARIAIVTAGAATHRSETRLSVAARSALIVGTCVTALSDAGFDGIILVASNPVDLMAMIAFDRTGLPASRIIGTGTLLDSSRLRTLLAKELDVASGSIDALVLGEHGDSEVALMSTVRVGGLPLADFSDAGGELNRRALAHTVRDAGYAIVSGKGYTSYGVATAIVRICEAIMRDEKAVLPVSTRVDGLFRLSGVYMSMPCIIGASGMERMLIPVMSADETVALAASGATLRAAYDALLQAEWK